MSEFIDSRPDLAEAASDASIKISGCPNGCGQHHVAALGFQGGLRRLEDGRVIPQYQLLGPKLFGQLKGAGKKIFVWTVNAPADAQRFSEWGVEGIISDNPKQLLSSLTGDKDK